MRTRKSVVTFLKKQQEEYLQEREALRRSKIEIENQLIDVEKDLHLVTEVLAKMGGVEDEKPTETPRLGKSPYKVRSVTGSSSTGQKRMDDILEALLTAPSGFRTVNELTDELGNEIKATTIYQYLQALRREGRANFKRAESKTAPDQWYAVVFSSVASDKC